jgi:type IV pilus assembly protein PilC
MAGPLAESRVFPMMVVQMIGVGEQTGAMDTMLQKIADFYEEEVDATITALTSIIESIMIILVGCMVATIILDAACTITDNSA